jgi:hypothetical protein
MKDDKRNRKSWDDHNSRTDFEKGDRRDHKRGRIERKSELDEKRGWYDREVKDVRSGKWERSSIVNQSSSSEFDDLLSAYRNSNAIEERSSIVNESSSSQFDDLLSAYRNSNAIEERNSPNSWKRSSQPRNEELYRKENHLKPTPRIPTSVRANITEAYFVHVPKTAGSALKHIMAQMDRGGGFSENFRLETTLGNVVRVISNGHKPAKDFPTNAFKFACIRPPVERFLSAFSFIREGGANHPVQEKVGQARIWQSHLAPFSSIDEFLDSSSAVKKIMDKFSGHTHFLPLSHWICDSKSRVLVNFFIRQTHLMEDFQRLIEHLQLRSSGTMQIPPYNVTGNRIRASWEEENRIKCLLKDDIKLYEICCKSAEVTIESTKS